MHLSASKISVLAASKAFHYSCSKGIQIFTSETESTGLSQNHLTNDYNICPDLPSAPAAQPLHSECSKAYSHIVENIFA